MDQNLTIIPVVNKIDLPAADVAATKKEIISLLGCDEEDILAISSKTGEGVEALLDSIVKRVPSPQIPSGPTKGLIFDSLYNEQFCDYNPVACSFWKSSAGENGGYDAASENVFLKPAAAQQIKIFKFNVIPAKEGEEGFLCVPIVRGSFTIILEGKGDKTQLSLPSN